MVKRKMVILITLGLLASTGACSKGQGAGPISATPVVAESPVETPAQYSPIPTPDFTSMTYVEKNNLYLELLAEQQTTGKDVSPAEEIYIQSLEAAFEGDTAQADQYLQQAILLLWNP